MKKLLALLMALFLPLTALADGPAAFSEALQNMMDAEFAAVCEAALAGSTLQGSRMAQPGPGEIAITRDPYDAFAVMFRPDGLMMLCHFIPDGDDLMLDWHNDLLLSDYQDIALSTEDVVWSGGSIPRLEVDLFELTLCIDQGDGTRLCLECDGSSYDGWRVTDIALYVSPDGERFTPALYLPEDCLADDIYLATCEPDDWRRGAREEDYYGW